MLQNRCISFEHFTDRIAADSTEPMETNTLLLPAYFRHESSLLNLSKFCYGFSGKMSHGSDGNAVMATAMADVIAMATAMVIVTAMAMATARIMAMIDICSL